MRIPATAIVKSVDNIDRETFEELIFLGLAECYQTRTMEDGQTPWTSGAVPELSLGKIADRIGLKYSPEWIGSTISSLMYRGIATDTGDDTVWLDGAAVELAERIAEKYLGRNPSNSDEALYFSVDASHIARLGLELVAKQETAVAELVKNGYDADAQQVDLIFKDCDLPGGSLEVFDNGHGMDLAALVDGFMRLSTQDKVSNPKSRSYNRQRAGRKGIGRFAAQRLGTRLTLITATTESDLALKLSINWNHFEAKKDLSDIPNSISRQKKDFTSGTKLIIDDLRDAWSDSQIKRAYRHISELIQPFPLSKKANGSADPGFKATFTKEANNDLQIVADDWTTFFDHALAEINGWVDENGFGFWRTTSKRYDLDSGVEPLKYRADEIKPYHELRNIHFKAFYYIDKELPRMVLGSVREKLQETGGIRLYRNGFRVLPYGERYDDWLKLNASNLMREILPPHSNRNFLGFVEISDVNGSKFEETSSREGLVENEAFSELKDFISSALKSAVMPIAEKRNKKKTTTETRRERRTAAGQVKQVVELIEGLKKEAESKQDFAVAFDKVVTLIENSIPAIQADEDLLIEELGMMRVLATLGLTIGEFTHEVGLGFESLTAQSILLSQKVPEKSDAAKAVIALSHKLSEIKAYLNYFDNTARDNVYREVQPLEIRDVINSFKHLIEPKIARNLIDLDISIDGYGLFTKPMHQSEWSSVLINFFTNSLKAIKRANIGGKMSIRAGREDGKIFVEFSDNGDGIPERNKERIFDAFFTTSSQAGTSSDDTDYLRGMGLGLKIVKDIADAAGGNIELVTPPRGYKTCFRIEVPEAQEQEIPEDAY